MRDLTPVLLESGFRQALAEGGTLEVHCVAPITHKLNVISGEWKFFVCEEHGGQTTRSVLVLQRNIAHRVMRTAAGVASLAASFGAQSVTLPLREGGIGVCELDVSLLSGEDPQD